MRGLAAAALALLALSPSALGEPIPSAPPQEVLAQIAAAQVPDSPAKVVVRAYINDIQKLDFKTNSYAVDLYVCFRWKASDLDPSKTMEFMNRYDPNDHQRDELYDKPKQMPDGSLYAIIRNQGRFSTKFQLADYPFDTQFLTVAMEDTIASEDTQIYVPDPSNSLGLDPQITLPGFKVGKPEMRIVSNNLPNEFRRPGGTSRRHLFACRPVRPGRPAAHGDVGQDLRSDRVDARRAATHVERDAPRCRLFDDARQDLSSCLRVHNRVVGAGGLDVMARGG